MYELDFNGQLFHELSLCRVANQGVKDQEGLTYLIGCELTQFTKQDYCLITGLRCDEPHDIKVEPQRIRLLRVYFLGKLRAFKECKNRDNAFKLVLVYFVEAVLIGAKNNVVVILYYLHLLEHMDRFNNFAWGSISFGQLHDNLSFAASRRGRDRVERIVREIRRRNKRNKKKLGEQRERNGLDEAAKYFRTLLREIVLTKVEKNKTYWTWGDDMDVMIHENLTLDTNDVVELKL
ncbi:DDRGK domain-containing protein 1-like [Pyrus ussuriensis x Pyrus communis]|uniref:DDRGK domain-containing protein 1-like n=1 Tax=Pyrus ussuriensis x Pyrus communis TaxID=2448454 RepID=A0A5N5HE53_9ROSA|nr:DDRGK domain-containing protein 1-like [Pyrus ussuriensis x Pyrus communis]